MSHLLAVVIDGITYASWLFIIAVGLTLIYGVMKILNMAHGSLYALGAYVTASLVGYWFGKNFNPYLSFLLLPLMMRNAPFGLIYADAATPGGLAPQEKELSLLRALRNQVVMAFRQHERG